ncbi:Non-histone chromosomal protein 6 [Coemansia sp. RSA 1722]|nr:Non-histone chromosomal protein 6 [Coemansia sp. RSA 486]KAJ2222262.1 Non-histone chromosomal protein 6 [Coemansia sp. RSA 485]KAJ2588592.1 Non-histone chromosomal protein 6 [Coemansia sp. RSA 1722]
MASQSQDAPKANDVTSKLDTRGKFIMVNNVRRAKKDPNAPKRSLSAYMFFSQANRKTVKDDNPEATFGNIGKILGDMWKGMSDKEKAPFFKQAEDDKKRYEAEKAAYVAENAAYFAEDSAEESK